MSNPISKTPGMAQPGLEKPRTQPALELTGLNGLLEHSLTPVNVLKMIRGDIQLVLGLSARGEERLTPFEKRLVSEFENTIRKGQCPSELEQRHFPLLVLKALARRFPFDAVPVWIDDTSGGQSLQHIRVFEGLQHRVEIANELQHQILALKALLPKEEQDTGASRLEDKIKDLRSRKDRCLIEFQRILFNDAALQKEDGKFRNMESNGKAQTIDELIREAGHDPKSYL